MIECDERSSFVARKSNRHMQQAATDKLEVMLFGEPEPVPEQPLAN